MIVSSEAAAATVNTQLTSRIFGFVDTATTSEMWSLVAEATLSVEADGGGYRVISAEALRGGITRLTVVAWVPSSRVDLLDEIAVPA